MKARFFCPLCVAIASLSFFGCSADDDASTAKAHVQIKNDFDNPEVPGTKPPWTICKASYQGVDFGKIEIGQISAVKDVPAGLDHVLMVAAWNDPSCDPVHALPIASKAKEEVVDGQTRTISIGKTNHQGPCPPEGVQPIPEEVYNRIVQLWPEYGFKPYAERLQNKQCAGSTSNGDAGLEGGSDAGADGGIDADSDGGVEGGSDAADEADAAVDGTAAA